MRILTTKKLYRAFPELDGFTDRQCENLVAQVGYTTWYGGVVAVSVAAAGFLVFFLTLTLLMSIESSVDGWMKRSVGAGAGEGLCTLAALVTLFVPPPIAGLLARDVVMKLYLGAALRRRIDRIRCLDCRYVLLGLSVVDSYVKCPECGRRMTLSELQLTSPEQLVPHDPHEEAPLIEPFGEDMHAEGPGG